MSSPPAPESRSSAAVTAEALSTASFLRVYARPTGDAVAAAGLLARAARALDTPFHVRTTREQSVPDNSADDDSSTVTVGWRAPAGVTLDSEPGGAVSLVAAEAVREAGGEPDPVLALAGAVAGGVALDGGSGAPADSGEETRGVGTLTEAARRHDAVSRRPGVSVPTTDLADGLAHTTLLRLPVSGDPAAAASLIREVAPAVGESVSVDASALDTEAHRDLASLVALDATGDAEPTAVAATERTLRPRVTAAGPFETIAGFADVLAATARTDPGVAVALALDPDAVAETALDRWRSHGAVVHRLLDAARTARYDGVFVVRVDDTEAATSVADAETSVVTVASALPAVARLADAFRAPEPTTLAVSETAAVVVTDGTERSAVDVLAAVVDTTDWRVERDGDGDHGDDETHLTGHAARAVLGVEETTRSGSEVDPDAVVDTDVDPDAVVGTEIDPDAVVDGVRRAV